MNSSEFNVWYIIISAIVVVVVGLFSVFWTTGRTLSETLGDGELMGALLLTTLFLYIIAFVVMGRAKRARVETMYEDEQEFDMEQ